MQLLHVSFTSTGRILNLSHPYTVSPSLTSKAAQLLGVWFSKKVFLFSLKVREICESEKIMCSFGFSFSLTMYLYYCFAGLWHVAKVSSFLRAAGRVLGGWVGRLLSLLPLRVTSWAFFSWAAPKDVRCTHRCWIPVNERRLMSKRRKDGSWQSDHHGGWVQLQPDTGLHALQHQSEPLPTATRPHVSASVTRAHVPAFWHTCRELEDKWVMFTLAHVWKRNANTLKARSLW